MNVDMLPSLGRALLYLGIPFLVLLFVMQYRWAKVCANNIRVLVAQKGGGGKWELAPKEGGKITIKNPVDGTSRTWPINELATIDVLYPGVGFVPEFMQKTIRLAVVNEGDWEPMLNRSPHRENIASPDIVALLESITKSENTDSVIKDVINKTLKNVSTGPTREMIADPAILGNLEQSSVMKALATVSNDFMDLMKDLKNRLGKVIGPNPMVVYIGLGLIAIVSVFSVVKVSSAEAIAIQNQSDLNLIKQSLGIQIVVPENVPAKKSGGGILDGIIGGK